MAATLVELDIFSGRPNPGWELDEQAVDELRSLHAALPASAEQVPAPPGLGYRGFRYTLDGNQWRAWRGRIVGAQQVLDDRDRHIESFLLSRLPPTHADLRERLAADIGSG
jgi:hypothetical protein